MIYIIIALQATAMQPAENKARLLVSSANGASTAKDYPSIAACETARDEIIRYNTSKIKGQTVKGGEPLERNLPVWASCLPL